MILWHNESEGKYHMQIFLAPRSNETSYKTFLSTIENGVEFSIVEPHLNKEGRKALKDSGKLYVWGCKETIKPSWDKMGLDDLVLFYKGREGEEQEGKLIYSGRLLHKQHSRHLGLALWPPKPGEKPWSCVFFLKDLRPVYVPISEVAQFAGYSKGFVVQGFMPLNESGMQTILQKFGTIDSFLSYYSTSRRQEVSDLETSGGIGAHAKAQMLLLKIGKMLGYDTYSPNKSARAYGETLQDHITLNEIPPRFLGQLVSIVREIDVIWFKDEVPKFAFEVEHTTKFGNGFQRLFQLNPLSAKLFLISSNANQYLFEKFVNADPFYKHKKSFHFRSYKQLEDYFRNVSEFTAVSDSFLTCPH